MDIPKYICVYPNAWDFDKALIFVFNHEFDVQEGTVNGHRSLELFNKSQFLWLLTFSLENGLLLKVLVGEEVHS